MPYELEAFQLLGLPRNADDRTVRLAYVRLLKRFYLFDSNHPPPPADYLARLQAAYALLRDDERRAAYEAELRRADARYVQDQRRARRRLRRFDRAAAQRWTTGRMLAIAIAVVATTAVVATLG